MSIEHDEARKLFEAQIEKIIYAEISESASIDFQDMEDEVFEEILLEGDSCGGDDFEIEAVADGLPLDNEVMSHDQDGNALSFFGDSEWYLIDRTGVHVRLSFGLNHENRALDFSDSLAAPLALAEKLLLYVVWPQKNLVARPLSAGTLQGALYSNRYLLDLFYREGLFLGDSNNVILGDRNFVTAKMIHEELDRLLDDSGSVAAPRAFLDALRRWVLLGSRPYCPDWFVPPFDYDDVIDRSLARKIAQFEVKHRNRWEAIPFDDLKPLFSTARSYIEQYSEDLFWLGEMLTEAFYRQKSSGPKGQFLGVRSISFTSDIYKSILDHEFKINPENKSPWFCPETTTRRHKTGGQMFGAYEYIRMGSFLEEMKTLVGASTFTLFSFMGGRHGEIRTLKTDALLIDGEPLDYEGDVIAQVKVGSEFDLTRSVFKMNADPTGRSLTTPVPKIVAQAFAILLVVFRFSREQVGEGNTDYLYPAGGVVFPWQNSRQSRKGDVKFRSTLIPYLKSFYAAAGVGYHFPHKCRKTLATLMINEDPASLEIIRWLLGHQSIAMTIEYIMALPGISDEVVEYYKEQNSKIIVEFIADTLGGYVAGPAGNRDLDSVMENIESWQGAKLAYSIKMLIKSFEEGNFTIHRTPAAWCVRFPTRVPLSAPCLPKALRDAIDNGEVSDGRSIQPRHEHCIPWKCGDAGHSRDDLGNAKRSLRYADKKTSTSGTAKERAHYQEQVDYWQDVVHQLEFGRSDITERHLLDAFLGGE